MRRSPQGESVCSKKCRRPLAGSSCSQGRRRRSGRVARCDRSNARPQKRHHWGLRPDQSIWQDVEKAQGISQGCRTGFKAPRRKLYSQAFEGPRGPHHKNTAGKPAAVPELTDRAQVLIGINGVSSRGVCTPAAESSKWCSFGGVRTTYARNSSELRTFMDSGAVPDGSTKSTCRCDVTLHTVVRTHTVKKRLGPHASGTGDAAGAFDGAEIGSTWRIDEEACRQMSHRYRA